MRDYPAKKFVPEDQELKKRGKVIHRDRETPILSSPSVLNIVVTTGVLEVLTNEKVIPTSSLGIKPTFVPPNNNQCIKLSSADGSALAIFHKGNIHLVNWPIRAHGFLVPRDEAQAFGFELCWLAARGIMDLTIVSGIAGSAKSTIAFLMALSSAFPTYFPKFGCGVSHTIAEGEVIGEPRKIVIIRPIHPVGGKDLGTLPGDLREKMEPWATAVRECLFNIAKFATDHQGDGWLNNKLKSGEIDICPDSYMLGKTIDSDTVLVVDEGEGFSTREMRTILTRRGEGGGVIMTGDMRQVDGDSHRGNGFSRAMEYFPKIRQYHRYAEIELPNSYRSTLAQYATGL